MLRRGPLAWPTPTVTATLPTEASPEDTVPIRIVVSAWHSNVRIVQARFYLDPSRTTAYGPRGLFYPVLLYNVRQQTWWPYRSVSRLTWPRTYEIVPTVPLTDFAEQGDPVHSVRAAASAARRVMMGRRGVGSTPRFG